MIDITKEWKTRCGCRVRGLRFSPYLSRVTGLVDLEVGKVLETNWDPLTGAAPDTLTFRGLGSEKFDLVPADAEPAAPPLPPLDARLFLTGCVLAGAIASTDETTNPDPRACTKWALDFVDGVLAELAERERTEG